MSKLMTNKLGVGLNVIESVNAVKPLFAEKVYEIYYSILLESNYA